MDGVFLLHVTDTDHYFLPTRVKEESHIVHCASENNEFVKSQNETLIQKLQRQFKIRLQSGLVQQHTAKTVRRLF